MRVKELHLIKVLDIELQNILSMLIAASEEFYKFYVYSLNVMLQWTIIRLQSCVLIIVYAQ